MARGTRYTFPISFTHSHGFHDKERVAFCLSIEVSRHLLIEVSPCDLCCQGDRLLRIERPQQKFSDLSFAAQHPEQRFQGMRGRYLLRAQRPNDEDVYLRVEA